MIQPNPLLVKIANCKGRGHPLLFAIDSRGRPGSFICHFVQFDTVTIAALEYDQTVFKMLHHDNDRRLEVLAKCVNDGKLRTVADVPRELMLRFMKAATAHADSTAHHFRDNHAPHCSECTATQRALDDVLTELATAGIKL